MEKEMTVGTADVATVSADDIMQVSDALQTDAQIRAEHYAPGRMRCAGPLALPDFAQRNRANAQMRELMSAGDVPKLIAFFDALNQGLGLGYERPRDDVTLEPIDTVDAVGGAIRRVILARIGCGQDLTELQGSAPFDGLDHTASCPKCHRDVQWTPPLSREQFAKASAERKAILAKILGKPTD